MTVNVVGVAVLLALAAVSARAGWLLLRKPLEDPAVENVYRASRSVSPLTNVTNLKVLIFYLAFFPSFSVSPTTPCFNSRFSAQSFYW